MTTYRRRKAPRDDQSGSGPGWLKMIAVVQLGCILMFDWNTVDGLALVLGVVIALAMKLVPAYRTELARDREAARQAAAAETAKIRATAAELGLEWVDLETGWIENTRYDTTGND